MADEPEVVLRFGPDLVAVRVMKDHEPVYQLRYRGKTLVEAETITELIEYVVSAKLDPGRDTPEE